MGDGGDAMGDGGDAMGDGGDAVRCLFTAVVTAAESHRVKCSVKRSV